MNFKILISNISSSRSLTNLPAEKKLAERDRVGAWTVTQWSLNDRYFQARFQGRK
jgi:putative alpha-1,2-mannosidase